MKTINGTKMFGYFEGLDYGRPPKPELYNEKLDDYKQFKNTISKEAIIEHMMKQEIGIAPTKTRAKDIYTNKRINKGYIGIIIDGEYQCPLDFIHYLKNYDIGIPYEYEEYLKQQGVK